MKNAYTAPEMEIIEFEKEDVITASPFKSGGPLGDVGSGDTVKLD